MAKVMVAIDSFKGCLSSAEAGLAASEGVRGACRWADVVVVPVSDGGEGMLDAFLSPAALGGKVVDVACHDPLMRPIIARYGITADGNTAIVESAAAAGLTLLDPVERNPMAATTYGVGEMLTDALRRGCRRIIVGLGGSATSDAGRGMLEALGYQWPDDVEVLIAGDVTNPLCGPNGAAHVYAPQKGATPKQVEMLDLRAREFAEKLAIKMGFDRSGEPGAGAAGGMGYALMQCCGAVMRSGADLLFDIMHFDQMLADAALVITGEGHSDAQTLMGKLPARILERASNHGVPVALLAGGVSDCETLLAAGFTVVESINPPDAPLAECLRPDVAAARLAATTARIAPPFLPL